MPEQEALTWDDVSGIAEQVIVFWVDGYELEWAHVAWDAFTDRGLAKYGNSLERTLVLTRFMSLTAIFCDFVYTAWGWSADIPYLEWIHDLDIHPVRVGQLLGMDYQAGPDAEGERLTCLALEQTVHLQRDLVSGVLLDVFDGEVGLAEALLLAGFPLTDFETCEEKRDHQTKMAEYDSMRHDPAVVDLAIKCHPNEYMEGLRWTMDGMTRPPYAIRRD